MSKRKVMQIYYFLRFLKDTPLLVFRKSRQNLVELIRWGKVKWSPQKKRVKSIDEYFN